MRTNLALTLAIPLTLLAAGCVNAPDEVDAASTTEPTSAALTGIATPYTFDGSFGPMIWACPLVTCEGLEPSSQRWTELDITGNLTALNLTMTWEAAGPHMETLRLGISWGENGEDYESVDGASPLLLQLTGLDISADDKPYLWTWVPAQTPVEVAYASTPTDFHIEGDLTTTEASP